jgi:hypothetical protein
MVQRRCPKCYAIFDRKSTFDKHINRKFDCSQNKNKLDDKNDDLDQIQNIPKKIIPKNPNPEYSIIDFEIPNINPENKINEYEDHPDYNIEIEENNTLICEFCTKSYSSKSNLNKHLKVCKVKKTNDEEKENIFKLLLEKEKQYEEEVDELKKQNKKEVNELKKQNKLLMDKINNSINNSISKNNEIVKNS